MRFEGIIPAVTTPFAEDGTIDTAALAANVRALLDAGVHGIVGTGTMGEAGSMTTDERLKLTARWAEVLKGSRVRLIVHVGANCLADSRFPTIVASKSEYAPTYSSLRSFAGRMQNL